MLNRIYNQLTTNFPSFQIYFFLRYLFAIFYLNHIIFINPKFFDYKKKEPAIKALHKNYGLNIKKIESTKWQLFQIPI